MNFMPATAAAVWLQLERQWAKASERWWSDSQWHRPTMPSQERHLTQEKERWECGKSRQMTQGAIGRRSSQRLFGCWQQLAALVVVGSHFSKRHAAAVIPFVFRSHTRNLFTSTSHPPLLQFCTQWSHWTNVPVLEFVWSQRRQVKVADSGSESVICIISTWITHQQVSRSCHTMRQRSVNLWPILEPLLVCPSVRRLDDY